jgi:hypothetical protein
VTLYPAKTNATSSLLGSEEFPKKRRVALDCRRHLLIIPRFLTLSEERIDDEGE